MQHFFGGYAATLTAVNEPQQHDESGLVHFVCVGDGVMAAHPTDRFDRQTKRTQPRESLRERERERERE